MFLDLGQRDFAKPFQCKQCGMLFVHGVKEDAKQHSKICSEYRDGVKFSFTSPRVVYQDKQSRASIVEILPTDSHQARQYVQRVRKIVNAELGFVASSEHRNELSPSDKTCYLYVMNKRVLGMTTCHLISEGHVLDASLQTRSNESRKTLVGIHQLWVHSKHRQRGIAGMLIDTVRKHAVFGMFIPPTKLSFSSPTEAGARFARRYLAKQLDCSAEDVEVLVYDCC